MAQKTGLPRVLIAGFPTHKLAILRIQPGQGLYVDDPPERIPETVRAFAAVHGTGKRETEGRLRHSAPRRESATRTQLVFEQEALVVVWRITPNLMTCLHVVFARAPRPLPDATLKNGRFFRHPGVRAKLRAQAERPSIHVETGLDQACIYPDEIFVTNMRERTARGKWTDGWLVLREEIPALLRTGIPAHVWVEHAHIVGDNQTLTVRIYDHEPTTEDLPAYNGGDEGIDVHYIVYRIRFDSGSHEVEDISVARGGSGDEEPPEEVQVTMGTEPKFARVGGRLDRYVASIIQNAVEETEPEEDENGSGEDPDDVLISAKPK